MRALALIAVMAAGGAWAAPAAAQTAGQVRTDILAQMQLQRVEDLRFGAMIPGASGGTATIDPDSSARTTTGSVTGVGGNYGPAHFQATGLVNLVALVRVPNNVIIHRQGGGGNMQIRNFTVGNAGLPVIGGALPVMIGNGGTLDVYVGGQLNVGANQAVGYYEGTFSITVNYQ